MNKSANAAIFEKPLADLFGLMDCYLSFIDSSLLQHVTRHLSNPVRDLGIVYSIELEELELKPISDILPHLPTLSMIPKGYSKLIMKVNIDCETTPLKDLHIYKLRFAKHFLVSQFDVFLLSIESERFIVWLVNLKVTSEIIKLLKTKNFDFFRSLDILKLTIDEECIFPPQTKVYKPGGITV